jgi:SAM-dependent methyltransferase
LKKVPFYHRRGLFVSKRRINLNFALLMSNEKMQTAERVSATDASDNYVFQRSVLAYVEAAKHINGKVLEIGCGEGYGIQYLAPKAVEYITVDKYKPGIDIAAYPKVLPPLQTLPDNYFDFVVSFQVIEHIEDDQLLVKEIARVLKPGGKFIVTTPNKPMSITRNPWHVREYLIEELRELLLHSFSTVDTNGVFGNEKVMAYYQKNKESVAKITRWDIFNLQYRLPRTWLQVPYDILNRRNRKKLLEGHQSLVTDITMEDYFVAPAAANCFDLFYTCTK